MMEIVSEDTNRVRISEKIRGKLVTVIVTAKGTKSGDGNWHVYIGSNLNLRNAKGPNSLSILYVTISSIVIGVRITETIFD